MINDGLHHKLYLFSFHFYVKVDKYCVTDFAQTISNMNKMVIKYVFIQSFCKLKEVT